MGGEGEREGGLLSCVKVLCNHHAPDHITQDQSRQREKIVLIVHLESEGACVLFLSFHTDILLSVIQL